MDVVTTTDHRSTIVLAIVDALNACPELAGVQREAGWPGEDTRSEAVWVDEIEPGTIESPVSGPATLVEDDRFTIPLEVRVSGIADLGRCRGRLGELCAAVFDTIRSHPDLDDLTGTGWVVNWVQLLNRRDAVWRSPAGAFGAARIELDVFVRLTSE